MNIFVANRWPVKDDEWNDPCWLHLRKQGHVVTVADVEDPARPASWWDSYNPDAIICMGITQMEQAFRAVARWPHAPLFCYNWDTYAYVWSNPRKEETKGTPGWLDYNRYGDLLKLAKEVWVPSHCTAKRCEQWWGLKNTHRILSNCPWWDHANVRDDGYALMCMREVPDPWWGKFEETCADLGIPWVSSQHKLTEEGYRDAVAGCRFICCPLWECSTGGLSLMEAYRLGKPVLLSDSEWNGGKDYFGERVTYFRHGDEQDFRKWLRIMANGKPSEHGGKRQQDNAVWIESQYSSERMADDVLRRIKVCLGK